jgi:hypothetical protein
MAGNVAILNLFMMSISHQRIKMQKIYVLTVLCGMGEDIIFHSRIRERDDDEGN